jgi:hypothetical protein
VCYFKPYAKNLSYCLLLTVNLGIIHTIREKYKLNVFLIRNKVSCIVQLDLVT